jgi:uncharacterized protein YbjT (DUF2867 family)
MEGVILGSTGLIGNELLKLLLQDPVFTHVNALVRKPLSIQHPKLEQHLVDFNDIKSFKDKMGNADVLFCCIGTTMKKMKGDREAYFKVDHDIAVNAANFAYNHGFRQFSFVSSVGADPTSNNFYLNLKGTTERAISKFPFQSIHVFRPSMLLGNRKEARLGETVGKVIMNAVKYFIPSKYKPIEASIVARAMLESVKKPTSGWQVYHNKQILELGG